VGNIAAVPIQRAGTATYGEFTAPYLLKRDLHHDNDNSPMFLDAAG